MGWVFWTLFVFFSVVTVFNLLVGLALVAAFGQLTLQGKKHEEGMMALARISDHNFRGTFTNISAISRFLTDVFHLDDPSLHPKAPEPTNSGTLKN
jgi:hypothetical protein